MPAESENPTGIDIVMYDPKYCDEFIRLNWQWIEEYFAVEDTDHHHLDDPERTIIDDGGDIIFLVEDERVLGTCALIREAEGLFELAKMAVEKSARGRGLGDMLIEATINRARELGAARIFLLSNRSLTPAISLYRKHGFVEVPVDSEGGYERADIKMVLELEQP